jgi:peptide/nickel transport system permease protein
MGAYIIRRLVYGVVTLFALSIIVFLLLQAAGGGPLERLRFNPRVDANFLRAVTEFYGLDQPIWRQYLTWLSNFVTPQDFAFQGSFPFFSVSFDWGISFQGTQPVYGLIGSAIGATFRLGFTALSMALIVGIPLGIYQALKQYSFFDQLGTTMSFVTFSTPIFIIGVGLQLLMALYLEQWTGVKLFWVTGMNSPDYAIMGFWARIADTFQHLTLPAVSIAAISIAGYARFQRASMLEVMHSDYLRTAKAKGLPRRRIIVKHALRNALIPIVTLVSLDIATIVGGAVITETIFGWPGIGRLYIRAINQIDYPVVMAVVMAIGIGIVLMNIVADILYGVLDPRVRYD